MTIHIAPMGTLDAEESAQLAGSLIASVLASSPHTYAPSEAYGSAIRALGLGEARDMAVGKMGWYLETEALCGRMERQGLLIGDGEGSYKVTALGRQLAEEQGVAAAGPLAQAHPWIPPPPKPPVLSKLKSWISARRDGAAPEQSSKADGPKP